MKWKGRLDLSDELSKDCVFVTLQPQSHTGCCLSNSQGGEVNGLYQLFRGWTFISYVTYSNEILIEIIVEINIHQQLSKQINYK